MGDHYQVTRVSTLEYLLGSLCSKLETGTGVKARARIESADGQIISMKPPSFRVTFAEAQ